MQGQIKNLRIDEWNRIENSETDPNINSHSSMKKVTMQCSGETESILK